MERFDLLRAMREWVTDEVVVTALGFTSREWFALGNRCENFYLLGSMGMVVPVGLGLAMRGSSDVFAIEGDGSCLMNLGVLATVGALKPKQLHVVVVDNGVYESTGGQPTSASAADFVKLAQAAGISEARSVDAVSELPGAISWLAGSGPRLLVARVAPVHRDVPRVPITPRHIAEAVGSRLTDLESAKSKL
ncbi:MAG: thiamine pyrophosphate-dependent enzyme [Chloroflexota bacterium]|nr:thiamine pyrophosphate-dependent enzyme [Chloroflexota bacterium]